MTTTIDPKELAFMQDPDKWPAWPTLPLVNNKGDYNQRQFGYLLDTSVLSRKPNEPTVYIGNIFDPHPTTDEKIQYNTFEQLLEDWRID